jgi:hypothetical protein
MDVSKELYQDDAQVARCRILSGMRFLLEDAKMDPQDLANELGHVIDVMMGDLRDLDLQEKIKGLRLHEQRAKQKRQRKKRPIPAAKHKPRCAGDFKHLQAIFAKRYHEE